MASTATPAPATASQPPAPAQPPAGAAATDVQQLLDQQLPVGPQPDMQAFGDSLTSAATQARLFGNMPSIAQNQGLMNMLTNLTTGMNEIRGGMNEIRDSVRTVETSVVNLTTSVNTLTDRVGTVETSVNTLTDRVGTVETSVNTLTDRVGTVETSMTALRTDLTGRVDAALHNAIAISKNAWARERDHRLTPLRDLDTNHEIANFPQTLGHLNGLNNAALIALLRHLHQPINGTKLDKLLRVKDAIGCCGA